MTRWALQSCIVLALIVVAVSQITAQRSATIQRIEFRGNRRVPSETLRGVIITRPGDRYCEECLQRDLNALRQTPYFESVRLEIEDSPDTGKIAIFSLLERPIVDQVEFHGLSSLRPSDVLAQFRIRQFDLSLGSFFDPATMSKGEAAIRELLIENDRPSAEVKSSYERIPGRSAVRLDFIVDEGPPKEN
jgi:outer membrane protein insertion porin family